MTETFQLVSGADPEATLYDGIAFYEAGEIYKALTCWRDLLSRVPDHEVARRYIEFVQGYLGIGDHANAQEVTTAQRREAKKLRGDTSQTIHTDEGAQSPAPVQQEAPVPEDSLRKRSGASQSLSVGTYQGFAEPSGVIEVIEEMIDEDLIEEEVVTRKPEVELPVTMLAKSSVEEMASLSEIAIKAVHGPEGPRTQADGLTVQALSRQLAELHRSGKYEEAVETAKRLLVQDPQHTVARRYIDEYHRQKQAALQAAMRRQQTEGVSEKKSESATMSQTHLGAPGVLSDEVDEAATAAPQAVSPQSQPPANLIPDLSVRPSVKMSPDQISWRAFDHRAGFFMSQVDGNTSYEDLIVISNMPREQALQILSQLVASGVIG